MDYMADIYKDYMEVYIKECMKGQKETWCCIGYNNLNSCLHFLLSLDDH